MDKWLKYFTKEEVAGFKNAENLYGKAYLICEKVFDGKSHSSGVPYMEHLVAVADRFSDDKAKVVALLHDIMKETELTAMDLNYIGFPSDIVKTVSLMTRENGESYDEFINRCLNRGYNKFQLGDLLTIDVSDFTTADYKTLLSNLNHIIKN